MPGKEADQSREEKEDEGEKSGSKQSPRTPQEKSGRPPQFWRTMELVFPHEEDPLDALIRLTEITTAKISHHIKPPKPYFCPSLPQAVSEVGPEDMEALLTKMAEGQQKLEKAIECFIIAAEEDHESIQTAITGQAERLDKLAQTQNYYRKAR
ncbi:hypothetical protein NDU88_000585 [Pleurodeles waltl]|uniref:Uncharacterized protein n=1 Tax=Pleurodeles waltl TaxID=8319 RepID=A0AAV7SWT8_PLEWA|nr:hypothetical protein NDU88_000585 [Pleurodeles waltl]